MKIGLIIIFVLCSCCISTTTAQNYFNRIYRIDQNNTIFTESIWSLDTLFIAGTVSYEEGRTATIFKLLKNGELIEKHSLIDTFIDSGSGFWDKGLTMHNDTLFHIALKGYSNSSNTGQLLKMDRKGNPYSEKEYSSYYHPNDNFCRFKDFVKLDDGYLVLDYARKTQTNFESCLIRTDLNFEEKWRKCYGNQYLEIPTDLLVTNEDEILILGNATNSDGTGPYIGSGQGFFRGYILLIDSLGTIKWEWRSPSKKEAIYAAHPVNDSLIVIAAGNGKEVCSDSQSNAVCNLVWTGKVFQFNIKTKEKTWETSMSGGDFTAMFDNRYLDIIPSIEKDGFILCGAGYNTIPDCRTDTIDKCWANPGIIAKVSNEGDSLWLRKYFGVTDIWESNILYDIEISSDSGYTFIGEAFNPWPGKTEGQHGWVLKTDKHGCAIPGCQIISSENSFLIDKITENKLKIFPNPAYDQVKFIIKNSVLPNSQVLVLSSIGEIVKTYSDLENEIVYPIQVSDFIPGVYFLVVVESSGERTFNKFVKL